jgi:hypothetical protein
VVRNVTPDYVKVKISSISPAKMMMMMIGELVLYLLKSFVKYLSNMPGKHEFKETQKTAIVGTAHRLREVLM